VSTVPAEVGGLVERFARNREAYRSAAYNETQARREFIDPLFKALGWDVDNESGLAEAYKDVIHEDAIKVGGATKAPDYCFRIGGTRKFFVEAKKPAVGVESDPEPAYQLRRYAWTSKLPLSILTDFEEFAVYDCRIPPKVGDKASAARVFYATCDQYAEHWDYIAGLFSKDAVLKGAFDKYAESNKRKKGTAEVDTEFLKQIEAWRLGLAQNFAVRNAKLAARDLNFAVQRTIDRLVFLRMCEDRGIEIYGGLQSLLNGDKLYERLAVRFRQADDKYNSGLFYFNAEAGREPPDTLTLDLKVDDKVLRDIIGSLYYPESPYEFSVLPPEILGQVYEQFLGKVIRLTAGHHAKVEEKPEVRKAGGVYYTPAYIVDYIVKNTVGKLLEERVPGFGTRVSGDAVQEGTTRGAQELPGPRGLAEGDGPGRGRVSPSGGDAAEGEIRPGQPDSTSSGVGPGEHCRGLRPDSSGRLSASPVDRTRVADGTGDAPDDHRPAEAGQAGAGRSGLEPVPTGRADADQAHRVPVKVGRSRRVARHPKPDTRSPIPGPLRILDPACGSGSFLLGAYQYLLDWHRDWYVSGLGVRGSGPGAAAGASSPSPESRVPDPDFRDRVYQGAGGQWCLTIQEKKRILLNHIHGVDIDPQAVETTKLSLLLKVLEGETEQTIGSTLRLFHERALPDLDRNIKCGNSLIGPDFYDGQQMTMFDEEERLRINAFDWAAEFPEVFGTRDSGPGTRTPGAESGFDAVIGNPPYGAAVEPPEIEYLRARYESPSNSLDSFLLFVEKAEILLRRGGLFGMIIPSGWVSTPSSRRLRALFMERFRPLSFVSLPFDVFSGAYIDTVVVTAARTDDAASQADDSVELVVFPHRHRILNADEFAAHCLEGHYRDWLARPDFEFLITTPTGAAGLLNRIGAQSFTVGQFVSVKRGIETYSPSPDRDAVTCAALAFTGTLQRYDLRHGETSYIAYTRDIQESKPRQYFSGERILLRQVLSRKLRLQAVHATETFLTNQSVQSLIRQPEAPFPLSPWCILAFLNSKLMSWYFVQFNSAARRDDFPKIIIKQTRELPLPSLALAKPGRQTPCDSLEEHARAMTELHRQIAQAKNPAARSALQRQIDATDRQIDQLVYELYGLTEEEIRIVEESRGGRS
jgi:hypothetical protein